MADLDLVTAIKDDCVDLVTALFDAGSHVVVSDGVAPLVDIAMDAGEYNASSSGSASLIGTPLTEASTDGGTADGASLQDSADAEVVSCGVNGGAVTWGDDARDAHLAGIRAGVDAGATGGKAVFREGSTILATVILATSAFAAPSGGSMALASTPADVTVAASGTPDNLILTDSDDNVVGTGLVVGGDPVTAGHAFTLDTFTITVSATGSGQLTLGRAAIVDPEDVTITSGSISAAA